MAKKKDEFYFDAFIEHAETARRAASLLLEIMEDFDADAIDRALTRMHEIENAGDAVNHEITDALTSAFITPIEREDIALLSERLDAVTDHLEGVLHRIYFTNVQSIRPSALEMTAKIVNACEEMHELVREFPQFKRNKSLREHIIAINTVEEEADHLFIESMRALHTTETDPIQVIAWRDVYTFLEYCADSCEHVAEMIDAIVMKNS